MHAEEYQQSSQESGVVGDMRGCKSRGRYQISWLLSASSQGNCFAFYTEGGLIAYCNIAMILLLEFSAGVLSE